MNTLPTTEQVAAEVDDRLARLSKNSRIMMVDDEPINMEVLEVHLQAEGYSHFISTSDSENALDLIRQEMPDILLLDLMMPVVSGFDILQGMRQDPELQHIPVLVLTSSDDSETKLKALSLGVNDFLAKPVDPSELALRLRNTLIAQAYQHQLTHIDGLTGLPNKKFLVKRLSEMAAACQQSNTNAALLLVNLDRFKTINDSLGRRSGDLVLHAFSQRLQSCFGVDESSAPHSANFVRKSVARLTGDKFAVLLPHLTDVQEAVTLASPFLNKMQQPLDIEGQQVYLSCSIGIAVMPSDGTDKADLLTHAETAMVHAKQQPENSYAFYSHEQDARARELLAIEQGLRPALQRGEFGLVYQPKVCVKTGQIVGAEALVRWEHPEYGQISPEHFVPLAEKSGMIVAIGDFVLNEACRQAVIWRNTCSPKFKIAVNVSIRQLHDDGFIEGIRRAISQHKVPPDALKIELTENLIMEDVESNVAKLNALKDIGVSLSIDDFGTGYSSLGYLQKFPLDELKVDKSFLASINSPLSKAPVARAIIMLAHDLGMSVVAEGIENHHQLAYIKALRCEEYQGYLCSSPLDAACLNQLIVEVKDRAAS